MDNQAFVDLKQSNEVISLFEDVQVASVDTVVDSFAELPFPHDGELRNNEMCFYRVSQLSFDEDYPRREAFENVLLAMDNRAFNFVYVLTGTEEGIELCIGIVQNQNENKPILGKKLSAVNYGEIVANVFEGNFAGSKLEKLKGSELDKLIGQGLQNYKNAGAIVGIPSVNEKNGSDQYDFQGVDRLVNTMLGLEWRLVVVCEPVSKPEILQIREDIYELYNRLSVYAKQSFQYSENDARTLTFGVNKSDTSGQNIGYTKSVSQNKGRQNGDSNTSKGESESNTTGKNKAHSDGESESYSANRGSSASVTLELANKHAEELMKYIDEDLLERLKIGFSKGLFKSSVYYMAKEPTHANRLKVAIMSLFQGNNSTYSPLYAQMIDLNKGTNRNILRTYQNQYLENCQQSDDALLLLGRPFYDKYLGLSSYLTTNEISLIAGLPQKEVPGLTLKESVGFGLNEKPIKKDNAIHLGFMVQKGRELHKIPFYLSKKNMAKHTFVAGVTGSGKTTTCHRLLAEATMPFLVIEPAKTEYRTLINTRKDIVVFTLGSETVAPFRINPFELLPGEVISAHVDMMKATFTSAFPMEASMPQLLEEAIYKCYRDKGWNIDTNENEELGDAAFDPSKNAFPIMSDLLANMEQIVKGKHFSQKMESDYIGSLVSRLSNLTVGSKGSMLNCPHSTNFQYIVNHNVILEMEELKSPEDKAFFMGFVLSRLAAVIKAEHKKNRDFQHLTLVEEAHRLLSKVEYGDSGSKKNAVETFTDLLAEVRKYGEGLIIVDQIPNKLAPEVLKNTNTKIIHKILARDDKETVGDMMLMNDRQKEYLSALLVGDAIVFSEQTEKPVHVHINAIGDTSEKEIPNEVVQRRFQEQRKNLGICYKYLELDSIFSLFQEVASHLKEGGIDDNKCEKLRQRVAQEVAHNKVEEEEAWRYLVTKRQLQASKEPNSTKQFSDRIAEQTDFFVKTFCKKKISKEEHFTNKDIINFL